MLRHVHWESTFFDPDDDVVQTRKDLIWLMEALCQRNMDYLRQRPQTPRLYKSGVKWAAPKQFSECEEVSVLRRALGRRAHDRDVARVLKLVQDVLGGEHFCDIGVILELGEIDCDGLACMRVAELRQAGIAARPMMTNRKRGGQTIYHALVIWPPIPGVPYETSEDPSLLLGMGGADRAADRQVEIDKNKERCEHLRAAHGQVQVPGQIALADPFASLLSLGEPDFGIDAIEDMLGLRRKLPPGSGVDALAAVEDALKRLVA